MTLRRSHRSSHPAAVARFALAVGLAAPGLAAAQGITLDPSGAAPAESDDGGDGATASPGAAVDLGEARAPAAEGEAGQGAFYYTDEAPARDDDGDHGPASGSQAGIHVVRSGDTLWDICTQYFDSPWEWPKVWSYNPEITNPHWIYPGNQVRLRAGGDAGGATSPTAARALAVAPAAAGPAPAAARPANDDFGLRQIAFVDLDGLRFSGRIDGSPEEKTLLSRSDEAYVSYPEGKPPKPGQRLSIYEKTRDVRHPDSGEVVGAYVRVVGETEILSVKKDKRARALITDSVDVIERGNRVGPLRQQFANVKPTEATADVQGTILEVLGADELIGARQVVFLDRGGAEGVAVGNRLYAVRRGDAYAPVMGPRTGIGKDDRRFPARALGELLVVEVSKHTSLAVVTMAVQELGIGDRVVLSRAAN